MELLKFFFPFGVALLVWVFISQILAWMISSDQSEEGIMSMWVCIYFAPILILYVLASWLQMKMTMALYANIQVLTFGMAPMQKPSQDLGDYIP